MENLRPLPISDTPFGLSALRFVEHLACGQINPFRISPSDIHQLHETYCVLDVVRIYDTGNWALTGCTFSDLAEPRRCPIQFDAETAEGLRRLALSSDRIRSLLTFVLSLATEHRKRLGVRGTEDAFLPNASGANEQFGIKGLRGKIPGHLATMRHQRLSKDDWAGYLLNLSKKGVGQNELRHSGVFDYLDAIPDSSGPISGDQLTLGLRYNGLRLSVVAVKKPTREQVQFRQDPQIRKLTLPKNVRSTPGQVRHATLYDPVLGFRIEKVEQESLWGTDSGWQLIRYDDIALPDPEAGHLIFDSCEKAVRAAQHHAVRLMPKLTPSLRWQNYAWTGGKDYREWLITLPEYPESFFGAHFPLRNILAHVRCDRREGEEGEQVLLIHELQSDWMAQHRMARQEFDEEGENLPLSKGLTLEPCPPFEKDWAGLTLRLMLLHAAHAGLDVLAWTTAEHQVERFGPRFRSGFKELYDRILIKEANRTLKPFGVAVEAVSSYVPENFFIESDDGGYKVRSADGTLLGSAATYEMAQSLIPDGGKEVLREVHAVRLGNETRRGILLKGIHAW